MLAKSPSLRHIPRMSFDDPKTEALPYAAAAFDWPVFGLIDDVRPALAAARGRGEPVALATLYGAVGGAPRGIGAQMVFGANGALAGFLSGGCVEADVALHAAAVLADGEARRLVYGEGGPLDIALPCGSRIDILVERIAPDDDAVEVLLRMAEARTPAIWSSDGETRTCAEPPQSLRDSSPKVGASEEAHPVSARPPQGEVAWRAGGGLASALVRQSFTPPVRVLIVGGDPVALATATLAGQMGYAVELIRPMGPEARPPLDVLAYTRDEASAALAAAAPDPWTAVCILTHDLAVEHAAVSAALQTPAAYIGVLGSRRRGPEREARLRASGFGDADLARLHAPIGLPIAGKAPWEIAVSVLAEVVQTLHANANRAE